MSGIVIDIIRVGHMFAFAVGIGAAMFLEIQVVRRFFARIDEEGLRLLIFGHGLIRRAVHGLWITGIALLAIRVGLEGAPLSDKLLAKLSIVILLTLNMQIIDRNLVVRIVGHEGGSIPEMPFRTRAECGAIAGFSAACWLGALLLGGIGYAKTMDGIALAQFLVPLLLAGAAGGLIAGALAGLRGRRGRVH